MIDFSRYAPCMTKSQSKSFGPFRVLQENATQSFQKIHETLSPQMKCGSGCSQCCLAEFSIFSGEASLVIEWFTGLSDEEKRSLREKWQKEAKGCAFLRNQLCTIYEARPIICRTQGAPLRLTKENKKEVREEIDACPLNFTAGIPKDRTQWLDLDRLTHLQVIAEEFSKKNGLILAEIQPFCDENGRIPLRTLQKILLEKIKD